MGISVSVTPMFLGEIAADKIRGSIIAMYTVMGKLGILYIYAIGPYTSLQTMAVTTLIPLIAFLLIFIWLPESPYFLLGKNKRKEAANNLQTLRCSKNVNDEFERISMAVKMSQDSTGKWTDLWTYRRSITIIVTLVSCQHFCGFPIILAYGEMIFKQVGSSWDAKEISIVLAVIQCFASVLALYIIDTVGRRPMIIFSVIGLAICNTIIGLYFLLQTMGIYVEEYSLLPIVTIMMLMVSNVIGIGTVTYALLAEIFPKNLKAFVGSSICIYASVLSAISIKIYQIVSDQVGLGYTFLGFALLCYLVIPYLWSIIPETKGKRPNIILDELIAEVKVAHLFMPIL